MTIKDAAIKVLGEAGQPLTVDEVYDRICSAELFEFKAKQPKTVLKRSLRTYCEGVQLKLSSDEKCFRMVDGKFALLR